MDSNADRIMVVTDLLLGAAHADRTMEGGEEAAVRRLLGELLGGGALPAEVDARIKHFNAAGFDLAATAAAFKGDEPARKRHLLELVAAVHDADDVLDLDEDEYLNNLAKALGMKREEYSDLSLDYEVEELRDAFEDVRAPAVPPPLPKK